MNDVLVFALEAEAAGLSVLPPRQDGTKAPDSTSWVSRQHERATKAEIEALYANGRTGLGVVTGAVSGGLEMFEFEGRAVEAALDEAFVDAAEAAGLLELVDRIATGYCERTPSGGFHWLFRTPTPVTTKLACGADRLPLIETKGEGGFCIVAPSHGTVHPSGKAWELVAGGFATIATVTADEQRALHDLARSFDQKPRPAVVDQLRPRSIIIDGTRPGDDFNARSTWGELLTLAGWTARYTHGETTHWCRPGKEGPGISATTNHAGSDLLYVFSSSTPFEQERSYDRFGAYAVLHHDGDLAAAAKALGEQGYGQREERDRSMSTASASDDPGPSEPEDDDDSTEDYEPEEPDDLSDDTPVRPAARLLNVRWVNEVYANPPPEPPVLVDGLLRKGELAVVGAPRAIGKSWFAMNLAAMLGRGDGLFLGAMRVLRPVKVLIAQGEIDEWGSWERWRMLTGTGSPPSGVAESFDRWRLRIAKQRNTLKDPDGGGASSEEWHDAILDGRLEATIINEGFGALIIDPWAVYFAGSENSNDETEAALDKLKDLAIRHAIAIVILHHLGKSMDAREPEDLWRGASRLADWASTRVTLLPHYTEAQAMNQGMTRRQARRYIDVKFLRRSAPTDDFSIVLDPETGWFDRWVAPEEAADARRIHLNPVDVAAVCAEAGGDWPSTAAAADALGVSHASARKLLGAAIRAGLIERYEGPRGAAGHRLSGGGECLV